MKYYKDEIIGFRVSTSSIYGKGHIVRCFALARELKYKVIFFTDQNFEKDTKFKIIREDSNFSAEKAISYLRSKKIKALIFDNYNIAPQIIESAAKIGLCAVIDDYKKQWKKPLIIAPNLGSSINHYKNNKYVFAGPEYALISDKFYKAGLLNKNYQNIKINSRVLIQIGAIDSKNNIKKILDVLLINQKKIRHITVVLSKNAPHREEVKGLLKLFNSSLLLQVNQVSKMISLYRKHNLIIGAAGVSLLERISLGIYCLTFSLNNNQDINIEGLKKFKIGINAGRIDKISNMKLKSILNHFIMENKSQYMNSKLISNIIDGKGSKRIIKIIKEKILNEEKLV